MYVRICYNGTQLYDITYNEDNCMCDLCREERIGTDYCYYCNYYKKEDPIVKNLKTNVYVKIISHQSHI